MASKYEQGRTARTFRIRAGGDSRSIHLRSINVMVPLTSDCRIQAKVTKSNSNYLSGSGGVLLPVAACSAYSVFPSPPHRMIVYWSSLRSIEMALV